MQGIVKEIGDKADLHIHSYHSDGVFSPEEIVCYAVQLGLKAISITDHDNVSGIEGATLKGQELGLEVISGVELSARQKNYDVHFVGYFIDPDQKDIIDYLQFFRQERLKRAQKIVEKLFHLGIKIELELVLEKAGHGSVGRPHIAEVMVEQGHVATTQEAFQKYLADGAVAHVPKFRISPEEAIELINKAGGLCFIAHPGVDVSHTELLNLIKLGLDGIETIHPRHTSYQVQFYQQVIKKYGLLETGGSDCHGSRKGGVVLGKYNIPYELVNQMKEFLNKKDNRGSK